MTQIDEHKIRMIRQQQRSEIAHNVAVDRRGTPVDHLELEVWVEMTKLLPHDARNVGIHVVWCPEH